MPSTPETPVVSAYSAATETSVVPQGTATEKTTVLTPGADKAPPAPGLIDNEAARLLTERFLNGNRETKPKAKTKPTPAEKPQEDATPKTDDESKAKAKPKAKAAPAPEPAHEPLDYDRLGEAVGKAVKAATDAQPKGAQPAPASDAELPAKEQRKLEYLRVMEMANPDKYKDVATRYAEGLKKSSDYEATWKREHPGETFDKADPQHDAFFDTVAVDWEDDDYAEAMADARAQALRDEMASKERQRTLEPQARQAAAESARTLLGELGGDAAAEALNPDGTVDPAKLADLDPVKADVLQRSANVAVAIGTEIERLFNGTVTYDSANRMHKDISAFALATEAAMLARPTTDQTQDGKQFAPAGKYHAMSAAQRAKHWTFTAPDLRYLAVQDLKTGAEKLLADREKEFSTWAEKKGMAAKTPPADAAKVVKPTTKPQSPTATVEPKTAGAKGQSGSKAQQAMGSWEERYLGRTLSS